MDDGVRDLTDGGSERQGSDGLDRGATGAKSESLPLVSCIMPTANRRPFVPLAIQCFMAQDYRERELVILDDGADAVGDLMPVDPRIKYVRLDARLPLGAKRNECIRASRGELIMHWDDDDWMAPRRISCQVEALLTKHAEVCGLRRLLFFEMATGQAWLYDYPASQRPWVAGGTLLYTRDYWQRAPFPAVQVGEDTRFIWDRRAGLLAVPDDLMLYVAMIHPRNTSPKVRAGAYWSRWPGDLRQVVGADLDRYARSASGNSPGGPAPAEDSADERGAGRGRAGLPIPRARDGEGPGGLLGNGSGSAGVGDTRLQSTEEAHEEGQMEERSVDLLYLARNRLEFTRETFTMLLATTDWQYVHELFVYDDGSVDGTREWLEEQVMKVSTPARFVKSNFGSPVTVMVDFIRASGAPILSKIDNDSMYPPGWLRQSLEVLDHNPNLALLGIEAMNPHDSDLTLIRSYTPAKFISGLGLYRRSSFVEPLFRARDRYFGLEEWQVAQGSRLTRGWINPALPVFLLDRMPLEPWRTYSESYVKNGWQRRWPAYDADCSLWHWRWPPGTPATPLAQAGDAQRLEWELAVPPPSRLNLGCVDNPLPSYLNVGPRHVPGIEAADLRQSWPWPDSSIDHVRAWDTLEHLPDKVLTMNELWRVLRPGATVEIAVPTTEGSGAWQDPTHVSYWNRRSFLYYEAGSPYRDRFAEPYGVQAKFRTVQERTESTPDGPRLVITLRAVKP